MLYSLNYKLWYLILNVHTFHFKYFTNNLSNLNKSTGNEDQKLVVNDNTGQREIKNLLEK